MERLRQIEIKNFLSIRSFQWSPSNGLNCLIGAGDSGKSTILDAIDWCLGARRNLSISDADFYQLNVSNPIQITITIGELDDALKNLDTYGLYLRGYNLDTSIIEDEPKDGLETVLPLQLKIEGDLEPQWSLILHRAEAEEKGRNLAWGDRTRLAPLRMGVMRKPAFHG